MEPLAEELKFFLKVADNLRQIDNKAASARPAPGKWSKKEILGHLIDSATNNHQRFVRMQLAPHLELPGYNQEEWVRLQHYQDRPWREIIDMWQMYNTQLVEVIRNIDPKAVRNTWRAPDGNNVDLEFVVRDYLVHMRHHMDQIL
ncbi:MAG TPA: DinB family protein [Terriglobia bacterium]|nr:DinB family protein [Terriglobia bacterium]